MELTGKALDGLPSLTSSRRGALSANEVVDAGLEGAERVLNVAALSKAGAKEDGVDDEQDPGAALEDNGREEDTDPEEELNVGNDRHGRIVVLLNETANRVGHRVLSVLGLGAGRSSGSRGHLGRGHDSRDQVRTSVGSDMEDRVDGEGKHGDGVLGHDEPDKGQN